MGVIPNPRYPDVETFAGPVPWEVFLFSIAEYRVAESEVEQYASLIQSVDLT